MTRKQRWILIAASAVALLVLLVWVLGDAAVVVESATVRRGTLREEIREEGRTRARDRFVVAAPITGRLERIPLREGDAVSAGQVLARIAPTPDDPRGAGVTRARLAAAEAGVGAARARLEEARGMHEQAAREAERRRRLEQGGALSREAREQAELQEATARRQVEAARAALGAALADARAVRAQLAGGGSGAGAPAVLAVVAPGPGRVLRVLEESERVVAAGTPLVEVGDSRGLEVVVDVLSEDAVRVRAGNPARIEEWGGEPALAGRVRLVEPAAFTRVSSLGVEEQRVNVVVDLLEAPPELGVGYRIEAVLVTWEGDRVLTVPTSALFRRGGEWTTFVVERGRAVARPVGIGHRGPELAEVLAGLEEGDRVVVFPSDDLEDGIRVRDRDVS